MVSRFTCGRYTIYDIYNSSPIQKACPLESSDLLQSRLIGRRQVLIVLCISTKQANHSTRHDATNRAIARRILKLKLAIEISACKDEAYLSTMGRNNFPVSESSRTRANVSI